MEISLSRLHHTLLTDIIKDGYAPSIETLAAKFQQPKETVVGHLKDLEDYHGVVLHPKSSEVWVIHPFSLAPTNFWVESDQGRWWGNCAWCSLGIVALLKKDATITTTLGGETEQIQIQIRNDQVITTRPLFVHFPIPMKNAWDNVIFTCTLMQIFQSEGAVDDWCRRHRLPKGDIQPLEHIWNFAQVWYGNHLDENWAKWTFDQAKDIFERFQLNHNVWQLPGTKDRF